MNRNGTPAAARRLNERLATRGFRFTRQRQHVYDALLRKRDHPTAEEVFVRARRQLPEISMATVYNCLDALVDCGLVRQVHAPRGAARFCPNMDDHTHFHCDACGGVFDMPAARTDLPLPAGFCATSFEIAVHGTCPGCGRTAGHRRK